MRGTKDIFIVHFIELVQLHLIIKHPRFIQTIETKITRVGLLHELGVVHNVLVLAQLLVNDSTSSKVRNEYVNFNPLIS